MGARGYLLDLNHVGAFIREEPRLVARANANPPECLVRICSITLGEIEAGRRGMTLTTDEEAREEYIRLVHEKLDTFRLDISEFTPEYYGEIIGRIWQKHPPSPKAKTERHLVDLGVDINDAWTVAVAWEHGLTLLTSDKMTCIREVVTEDEVKFDNWLA